MPKVIRIPIDKVSMTKLREFMILNEDKELCFQLKGNCLIFEIRKGDVSKMAKGIKKAKKK